MKYLSIVIGGLLAAGSASAGTLSLSATTAQGTQTRSVTVPDTDLARVTTAYKSLQGQVCDGATPPVCRDRTNAEVFQALADAIFRGIRDNVMAQEKAAARQTADSGITPIAGVP